VPEPLEVNSEHLLRVYIGLFNIVEPLQLRYYEAGILIPTCYKGMAGAYMPVLYLNQALPITMGREVWGFPKFDAEVTFTEASGIIHGSVSSQATPLIKAEVRLAVREKPPTVEAPMRVFLLKSIPSVQQNASPDVKQLCTAMVRDQVYAEWHPGVATLTFDSTRDDPLGAIPIVETVSGVYYTRDFVLDYGKVVYDYLTEPAV
jgi:acetoacetate decarboxylase